jgi:hypothetical protein
VLLLLGPLPERCGALAHPMDRIPIAYTVCESSLSDTEQNRCLTGVKILGKKKKGGLGTSILTQSHSDCTYTEYMLPGIPVPIHCRDRLPLQ